MAARSSTPTAAQRLDKLELLLTALVEQQTPTEAPKQTRSSSRKAAATVAPKTQAEWKVSDPDRKASVGQWYSIARRMFFAATGEALPQSLTMGDVEAIFDGYPLPPR